MKLLIDFIIAGVFTLVASGLVITYYILCEKLAMLSDDDAPL